MALPRVAEEKVASFRLRRHHLDERASHDALAPAAGEAGGIQAQLASAARMGLWCRVEGVTPDAVDRGLWEERSLVKTWAMRGALHLLPAGDLPLFLGGLRREGLLREKQWMSRYGLKEEDFLRMSQAIEEALASGPLTRRELAHAVAEAVGARGRPWVEHGYGGVVSLACLEGRVCFGRDRGREVTFVRVDDWLPSGEELPVEEAEEGLLRRYLRAFGPATPQDYAAWSGMRVRAVREIWGRLDEELAQVSVAGREATLLAEDVARLIAAGEPPPTVRLLPHFDGYLLGHKDKGHLVAEPHYKRVYRKAGWISPVLLVGGRAAGTWEMDRRAQHVDVAVTPFARLSPEVGEALEREGEALGTFLGKEVRLVVEGVA